ncbi:hypothetical protein CBR_g23192 [Chara braunii]|uniref:Reverse transcriptase n=1 Tax=Chara braunii TaxID=69332 RepID=A0A388JV47_CHABU|nr:hypothetical protein CBR_g23192 [Chara braunii]|eukprot:GBG61676.1 hypothetical protein CBR_g23192 [Chara braunii]
MGESGSARPGGTVRWTPSEYAASELPRRSGPAMAPPPSPAPSSHGSVARGGNQGQGNQGNGGRGGGRGRGRNGGGRGGQWDNQGYQGQGNQGNQGSKGSGRTRFDWRTAICQHCDKQGRTIQFCNTRREDERVGLIYSNMDGDIYDQFAGYIDRKVPGGVRAEAQRRVAARQAPPATFRLWQEKEDPPIRVEEVGSDEEVTQRLRAGDIKEEPIVVESENEEEEERVERPSILLGKMEDLLDKLGRYQQKLVDLCEGVKEWRANIPKGHNDLMTLKEILASTPKLRDRLKGRLSRRLVPNVHLSMILPKEAEWVETGTKMDWKCVACGTVDLVGKGSKCSAMVDTRAEMNIIREADAIRFELEIDRSDCGILHGANCKAVFCGTASNVLIEVGRVKARACFFVMPDVDHMILLGRSFLCKTEALMFNKHDGTLILIMCDPACGNYDVITCRNTGPRSIRSRPNPDSFMIEESEGERQRLLAEPVEEERVEAFSLSLSDVNKAMDIVATHEMADPDTIQASREQLKQGSQRRYKTIDKKCRPVPVLVTEDEEVYYERERGLIRQMKENAAAGPCRINGGNQGKLIIGEPDFLLPQERALMVELMKKRHRAYAFGDEERGRLTVDKIRMIRIHTVPHEPWNLRGARYPNPDEEKKVVDYLDGKILSMSSGSYASPWFCFIKPNGTLRWVQDLSVTAMHTPRGLIQMHVVPQGWTNAVAMVQPAMIRAMQSVNPHITQPYIDDLAVKGPTVKENDEVLPGVRRFVWKHIQDLEKVLNLLEEHNLTASGAKSRHCMREATILGFVCNEKGRRPDVKKTDKIIEWPVPFHSITDVRSFLDTCGFWRIFVKNFVAKIEHLRKLVRQDQEWVWGEEQERAVAEMKEEFKEGGWPTYIWMFNFELERIPGNKNSAGGLSRINWGKQEGEAIEDTSSFDGFLDQEEDIHLHINKWSPRVPSCMGHSIWHAPNGYERKAELVLKPFEEEDPWGGKDVQWMMKLALAGTHSLAEEVRAIEEGPDQVERHEELMGGMYLLVNTLLQGDFDQIGSLNPAENEEVVSKSQDDEFEEGEIKEAFRAEEYDGIYLELGLLLSCEMRNRDASDRAQRMMQRYLVRDGHLFIKRQVGNPRRVVCGRSRQIDVVAALHDGIAGGHRGVSATYAKMSELYYWDGMMEMVSKFCRSCVPCQEQSRLRPGEPLHPRLEREVGAVVHLDLLFIPLGDHGYNYIFDARDNLSDFVDGRAIRTKTGPVLVSCIEEYYLRYPFVREFVMDRGSEFTCQAGQELLSRYGMVANYTTVAHPQANAAVERGHNTITSLLAKWTEGRPNQWPRYLRAAFFVENITVKRTTKYAPATLWYGRHATFPIESFLKTWRRQDLEVNLSFEELLDIRARQVGAIEKRIQEASNQVEKSRMEDKARWDQSARVRKVPLAVGDVVLLYDSSLEKQWSRKLDKRWLGPYRIVRRGDFDAYQIEDLNGTEWKDWVSGARLKKSDFTKTAMPRGGRGTRPSRRSLGASGGYERHGSHHRESTPVYDDGDIELFLDEFWGYADHMGWAMTQAIERLGGADRFAEPIAPIRREARTRPEVEARMQELRPSPVGPDGIPIRLEIGNAEEFIPAFEQFMHGQAEREIKAEIPERVDRRTRERVPAGETAEEKRARVGKRLEEIWQERQRLEEAGTLPDQPPPHGPYGIKEIWDEFLDQHGEELTAPEKAEVGTSKKADEYLDRKIRSLSTTSFDRYMMLEADLRGKEMEVSHGVCLEAVEAEIRELRALAASKAVIIQDLRQQLRGETGRVDREGPGKAVNRAESSRQGEQWQAGHGLSGQPSAAKLQQGSSMGRIILNLEEAKAKREAEREAFEFIDPTELATLPIVVAEPAMPPPVEEGRPIASSEPVQGSTEGSMDVLLEAVHFVQEEASLCSPEQRIEEPPEREMGGAIEGVIEGRPQRLDTPEYRPEGVGMRLGPSTQELGTEPEESMDVPQSYELGRETSKTPSSLGSQKEKKKSKKWFDASCYFCKKEGHRALQCPKYILDVRDNLSGFVEAVALKKKTGRSEADWIEDFYLRHPFVRRFIASNGTEFVNQEVLGMLKRLCVPIKLIEPYHPEANAPVERGHRTLKNTIAKLAADHLGNWPRYLKQAVFAENMTPKRTTGCIPTELWYGREIDFPVEALVPTWNRLDDDPQMTTQELIEARCQQILKNEEVMEAIANWVLDNRMRDKTRWDQVKNVRKEPLQVGELVLLRNSALESTWSGQLGRRFKGPYQVAKRVGQNTFELEDLDGTG